MARFPIRPASPNPRIRIDEDATLAVYGDLQYLYDYIESDTGIIGQYEADFAVSTVVPVTTMKGIIDVHNMDQAIALPGPALANAEIITLQNPILTLANRENLYLQLTPYYAPAPSDNVIPYILATGFLDGLQIAIFNMNPAAADTDNWKGSFYIYYEIKEKN